MLANSVLCSLFDTSHVTLESFKLTSDTFARVHRFQEAERTKQIITQKNSIDKQSMLKASNDYWVQCGDIVLSKKNKQQILNGSELCNLHVNAFQNLLKGMFPHNGRLINALLQSTYTISATGTPILHTRGSHWATLYVNDKDIHMYDSAYTSVSDYCALARDRLFRVEKTRLRGSAFIRV